MSYLEKKVVSVLAFLEQYYGGNFGLLNM